MSTEYTRQFIGLVETQAKDTINAKLAALSPMLLDGLTVGDVQVTCPIGPIDGNPANITHWCLCMVAKEHQFAMAEAMRGSRTLVDAMAAGERKTRGLVVFNTFTGNLMALNALLAQIPENLLSTTIRGHLQELAGTRFGGKTPAQTITIIEVPAGGVPWNVLTAAGYEAKTG